MNIERIARVSKRESNLSRKSKSDICLNEVQRCSTRSQRKIPKYFLSYEEFPKRTNRKFKCELCKIKLSSKEILRRHILVMHIKLKPHICDVCHKGFIFEKSLLLHKEIHSDVPLYRCVCSLSFQKKASFKYHMKVNHSVGLFTSLKCVYCYRHFKDKKQLRYHLQAEHTPKIIECTFPSCRRLFSTKPFLQHHLKTHSEKRYACSICKKEFKVKSYMEKHKATHEDIRPYKCSDCDKTYMSVSHVNGHWKRSHSLTTNYLCSICGKTFKNKLDLTYHENAHQGWKPFKCELCNYSTSYKPSLINHTKKHSSSRKKADTKIKSIRPETERTNKKIPHYTKIESELRPYKCLDCDSTYKTAVRANEHWRRYHMVRTEFRCPFCHTVFTNEKAFNIHKTHHEEQQLYKCDVCSYQTAFRIGFFTHQKTHSKLAKQSGQAARCVKNITNANTSFPQKSNGKKFVEEISMYEGVTNSVFDNCNESPKILNEELIPLMNDCEKIAEDFDSSQIKWTLSDEDTSVKEKPRSRLKEHSFFSYVKMEGDDYVWDEDECKQLSEGLILEQAFVAASGLDLDVDETLRAPNWTSLPFQETPSNLEASNHFSSPLIGKRSDPKITLNCTAIDNVIEENQFHFEI